MRVIHTLMTNSKRKGNRIELDLAKLLSAHFGQSFSRSVGSGNRWGQVNYLPQHAKQTLIGDLCVPENFRWVVECKGGYDHVDLASLITGDCPTLDGFVAQSTADSALCGRLPLVAWKRSRKPWLACLRLVDCPVLPQHLVYRDWVVVGLDQLLATTPNTFWFG